MQGARWQVWRQDDNGNQALVAECEDQLAALELCETLESRGHKQLYWVACERPPAGAAEPAR